MGRYNKEQLVRKVYEYFPQGISDTDKEYAETSEYKRLQALWVDADKVKRNEWASMLRYIKKYFNGDQVEIENWSEDKPYDRCISGVLIRKELHHTKLVFCVSILQPYYVFYERISYDQLNTKDRYSGINFSISSNYYSDYLAIKNIVVQYFPSYEEFPAEFLTVEIEDISYNGVGLLSNWNSLILRKMTLFDAVFSETYL